MHRRELTALSTAARTRVHYHFYLLHVGNFVRRVSHPGVQLACARRERETATRRAKMCKTARAPWEQILCPALRWTVHYMRHGVFVLTIDGRRTGAPHGTLLAAPRAAAPRWYMLYLRRYCHIICTIGHEVPPRIEVSLQDLHKRGTVTVTAPALRAANTGSTGSTADAVDGPAQRGGGRRSSVDLLDPTQNPQQLRRTRYRLGGAMVKCSADQTSHFANHRRSPSRHRRVSSRLTS